jgi:hypothetical protein
MLHVTSELFTLYSSTPEYVAYAVAQYCTVHAAVLEYEDADEEWVSSLLLEEMKRKNNQHRWSRPLGSVVMHDRVKPSVIIQQHGAFPITTVTTKHSCTGKSYHNMKELKELLLLIFSNIYTTELLYPVPSNTIEQYLAIPAVVAFVVSIG